jgi:hypothetical protein
MKFEITIPNNVYDKAEKAFVAKFCYLTHVEDDKGFVIPNPQTKKEFFAEKALELIKKVVIKHEVKTNETSTRQSIIASAELLTKDFTVKEV